MPEALILRKKTQHCFSVRPGEAGGTEGGELLSGLPGMRDGVLGCMKCHVHSYSYGKDAKCS